MLPWEGRAFSPLSLLFASSGLCMLASENIYLPFCLCVFTPYTSTLPLTSAYVEKT